MPAPLEFKIPSTGEPTHQHGILKGVAGSLGTLRARFFTKYDIDFEASKAEGIEIKREMHMVGIKTDPYTEYAARWEDLSDQQRADLSTLYERFLSNRDSTETPIDNWEALQESERVALMRYGIETVEQLARFSDAHLARLGNTGREMRDRAARHVAAKGIDKNEDIKSEMAALRQELERQAARNRELEEAIFAQHAAKANNERRGATK